MRERLLRSVPDRTGVGEGLPETQRLENCGEAYLRAIAASLGMSVNRLEDDYDSVDLAVRAKGFVTHAGVVGPRRSPMLNLQLKCTYAEQPGPEGLKYRISAKNYDDLRSTNYNVRRILDVVSCPAQWPQRLRWTQAAMRLKHCAYWTSLEGREAVEHETVTVRLAKALSPEELARLMLLVSQEAALE